MPERIPHKFLGSIFEMALNEEQRSQIDAGLAEGKTPKDLAAEVGVSVTTIYNYKKQERDDPEGVAPPNVETTGTGRTRRIKKNPKPITEETAGNLCAGIFAIAAMMDGPEWFLSSQEKDALSSPLADSLRILPAPIAEGVNLYSAPVVFVTTLSTIMYSKGKQRAMRGIRPALRVVTQTPPVNNAVASTVAGTANGAPTPPAPVQRPANTPNTVDTPADILAAAAAARGGLQGIDEADDATSQMENGLV